MFWILSFVCRRPPTPFSICQFPRWPNRQPVSDVARFSIKFYACSCFFLFFCFFLFGRGVHIFLAMSKMDKLMRELPSVSKMYDTPEATVIASRDQRSILLIKLTQVLLSRHKIPWQFSWTCVTLHWRQNECDGVSNHRRLDCLLN